MSRSLAIVAALFLVPACEKAGPEPGHDMKVGELRVTGVGATPLEPLRYHVAEGTRFGIDMTVTMNSRGSVPVPAIPVIHFGMDGECTRVDADGNMSIEMRFGEVRADGSGPIADAVEQVGELMRDIVQRFRISPSGQFDQFSVDGVTGIMAPLADQMRQNVEQFAVPLPDQPVGPGARWRVKRAGNANGMDVVAVVDFELLERHGDRVRLRTRGTMSAKGQKIDQGPITVDVARMKGTLSGEMVFDLAGFVPEGRLTMNIDMTIRAGGDDVDMGTDIYLQIAAR